MKITRIFALFIRYWFYLQRSYDRLLDVLYWPLIDLLLWGITSRYITTTASSENSSLFVVIFGLLFWIVIWRSQYEISINLLQEFWDANLLNIFISPLTLHEWLFSTFCIGFFKVSISFIFASSLSYILYGVNIFLLGPSMFFIILGLLIMGWTIGMFIAGLTFMLGTKAQTLGSAVTAAISPFSAVFYPVSQLPEWARVISSFIPISYFFEGLRSLIFQKSLDLNFLFIPYAFSLILFFVAYIFLHFSFKQAKIRGLLRS